MTRPPEPVQGGNEVRPAVAEAAVRFRVRHEELYRTPPAQMTDAEFLAHLDWSYRRAPGCWDRYPGTYRGSRPPFSLLEFTGMTGDEYAAWIMHGTIPERVMRVEGRRGTRSPWPSP